MGAVQDTKVAGSFLKAGIHNVIFKGIDKIKIKDMDALEIRFVTESGDAHNEHIFAPTSDKREEGQFGLSPSRTEQFMCIIKQIISALDPDLAKKLETDGDKFAAPTFDGFVSLLKKYLDKKIGAKTQIKLVPNRSGYPQFPGYIAALSKEGNLYMKTKIIGDNLVLTPREKAAIEAADKARPTNMANKDELADIRDDFEDAAKTDPQDDLPF